MTLRAHIIRLAHANPALRPHLLPLLKESGVGKTAIAKDTEDFIAWALERDQAWSESEVQRFLERVLGREPSYPSEAPSSRKTGPLDVGEKVLADKFRNTNEMNVEVVEKYHDRVGFVKDKTPEGLVVQFYRPDTDEPDPGAVAFFNGFASGKATGLYRWTPKPDYQQGTDRVLLEVVYLRGGQTPPPQRDIDALREYIESGLARGEQRSEVYYSGYVGAFAFSKEGNLYFTLSAQQRDRPTTISPKKGRLLYIGIAGRRPGGWKAEWQRMHPEVPATP